MRDEKPSKRRDVLKKIGVVGASSVFLTSSGSASAKSTGSLSKRTARKIAKKSVGRIGTRSEFDDWREQGVKSPELFYAKSEDGDTIQYTPRAWVFPIENQGEDVGYITIDAMQQESPVLAYGRDEAPQRSIDDAMKVAKATGNSVHKRFLYHGGTQFGVETRDKKMVDLRGQFITGLDPVKNADTLKPTRNTQGNGLSADEKMDAPDWSGSTDDEVYGVPNWRNTDPGNASSTNYGTGADSWADWDGCTPIAASMVIGYHEGLSESDADEREALIDRLHVDMDTDDDAGGATDPTKIDNGIENYQEGSHSYNANNQHFELKGNVEDGIGNDEPPVLSMWNGPYTKDKSMFNGHSVAVVGYRAESCGSFCNNFYHKVHNTYGTSPDRVANGNWNRALITRVEQA